MGKTTMAAAFSLRLEELMKKTRKGEKRKICIVSTDPASTLAESFNKNISDKLVPITKHKLLFARNISAKEEANLFRRKHGENLSDLFRQGTYLSDEEVEDLIYLELPGVDEIMGLKVIADLLRGSTCRKVIVDTAPTGHTLRMLVMPQVINDWIKYFARLRRNYHAISRRFSGEERLEGADALILELKKTVVFVEEALHNPKKTEFVVVTNPERIVIEETLKLIREFKRSRIPSRNLIVNNVAPSCSGVFWKKKRNDQEALIGKLKKQIPGFFVTEIFLQPTEIRGIAMLGRMGRSLLENNQSSVRIKN